ncbi:MAG: hypothetical protein KBD63_02120 [Bacteriovoracaceae bacterium]|nr:hypothetical protein [Bacteriovoracaceae bacterium]
MAITKSAKLASEFLNGSKTVSLKQIEKQAAIDSFEARVNKYSKGNDVLKFLISILLIVFALICLSDSE